LLALLLFAILVYSIMYMSCSPSIVFCFVKCFIVSKVKLAKRISRLVVHAHSEEFSRAFFARSSSFCYSCALYNVYELLAFHSLLLALFLG
jgi:hypothetical protein